MNNNDPVSPHSRGPDGTKKKKRKSNSTRKSSDNEESPPLSRSKDDSIDLVPSSPPRSSGKSTTMVTSSSASNLHRRSASSRGSMLWATFDERDFENELSKEFESKWRAGASGGSMMLQTIKSACKRIWGRPIVSLCLQSDLPRLSHNLEIVDERTTDILFKDQKSYKTISYKVKEILTVLARTLDSAETAAKLGESFDAFSNANDDAVVHLESWLKALSTTLNLNNQPKWLQVLRCINQGIVFPAVFHMKKLFGDKFAYKDTKGSWKVRVSIVSKDTIEIQHRKGEKSQLTGVENNFTFSWQVTYRLNTNTQDLDVVVSILDYILDKDMQKETRTELLTAMQPFLSPSAPYLAIWKKPVRKLSISKDFGRLCNRLSIHNHTGKPIFLRSPDLNGSALVTKVLLTLVDCFNPELTEIVEESISKRKKDDSDMIDFLASVLVEDKVVPDDSAVAAVLKCINTNIVFPAVDRLHSLVYDKLRYRDVRGTWTTHITLGPAIRQNKQPNASSSFQSNSDQVSSHSPSVNSIDEDEEVSAPRYRYISILHRKCEQAHSVDPKEYFQFEWVVELHLNREMTLNDATMGIISYNFGLHTSEEMKNNVLHHLKPLLRPSTFHTTAGSISSQDILDLTISKIAELESLHHTLIYGHASTLPHSIPIISLLKSLKSSIADGEIRLPSLEATKQDPSKHERTHSTGSHSSPKLSPSNIESQPGSITLSASSNSPRIEPSSPHNSELATLEEIDGHSPIIEALPGYTSDVRYDTDNDPEDEEPEYEILPPPPTQFPLLLSKPPTTPPPTPPSRSASFPHANHIGDGSD